MSDPVRPHGLGFPVLHHLSNSRPFSWRCHPTISSSVVPFVSCLQSFPASGSFLMSWLFASGGQSIEASAAASVLSMSIQGWFSLRLAVLISLAVQGVLKSVQQHHSSKASILWCFAFFILLYSCELNIIKVTSKLNRWDWLSFQHD